jgi:hypothetical protein
MTPLQLKNEAILFHKNFLVCMQAGLRDKLAAKACANRLRKLGPIETARDAKRFFDEYGPKWGLSPETIGILASTPIAQLELVRTAFLSAATHVQATGTGVEIALKTGYAAASYVDVRLSEIGTKNQNEPLLQLAIRAPQFRGELSAGLPARLAGKLRSRS